MLCREGEEPIRIYGLYEPDSELGKKQKGVDQLRVTQTTLRDK